MSKLNNKISFVWVSVYFLTIQVFFVFGFEKAQQKELDEIRREISRYEEKIEQNKSHAQETFDIIAKLDKEISLASNYLNTLGNDIENKDKQIRILDKQILALSEELAKLRNLIKKRIVAFYKYGRSKRIGLLLESKSIHQVQVWMRFQKAIFENDKRNYERLKSKKTEFERKKELLQLEIADKERIIRQKSQEESQLKKSRNKREKYLSDIQNKAHLLEQHLKEIKESESKILDFIEKAEDSRLNEPTNKTESVARNHSFYSLKGHLSWPTNGKIISHFGRQKHPKFNTITENLGIEIKAYRGAPVKSVDDGRVQTITWQRGRGNIIIISHSDGYYTVYTNLEEIKVKPNNYVKRNQIIGTVGESNMLNGAALHFQIWKNTHNLDPEDWLI